MKLDRLIGIIMALQRHGNLTAPVLAEKFEVSRRTIQRDIEAISRAGLPPSRRREATAASPLWRDSACRQPFSPGMNWPPFSPGCVLWKAYPPVRQGHSWRKNRRDSRGGQRIQIDLASFYRDDLSEKIAVLRRAIREHRPVSFRCYYSKGVANTTVEPYRIVFRWSDWYPFGWCTERKNFRLYKLRRLWELHEESESFPPRPIPSEMVERMRRTVGELYEKYKGTGHTAVMFAVVS